MDLKELTIITEQIAAWTSQAESMLPKKPEEIANFITAGKAVFLTSEQGSLMAFGAISFEWPNNWKELGAVVVNPEFRKQGWGHQVVLALIALAKKEYPEAKLFALCNTLSLPLFLKAGGEIITDSSILPSEVWGACADCPMVFQVRQSGSLCCDVPVTIK
jgi:N-acetylglutamate synthase-like GNAT family acetyltransferase